MTNRSSAQVVVDQVSGRLENAIPRENARARARGRIVSLVTVVYVLLIIEGAIRKWVFPEFGMLLFFVRDPFVIFIYAYATIHRLWPKWTPVTVFGAGLAAIGIVVGLIDLVIGGLEGSTVLLAAYGWRNYFFYPPLAFLIGSCFRRQDLERLFRLTILLAIPMAVLVAVQFWAPIDSPINVGIADEKDLQFRGLVLDGDHTRAMGTFTSINGQVLFVASSLTISLALLILPRRSRPFGSPLLITGTLASLTSLALGGSRFMFLHVGISVISALCFGVLTRSADRSRRAIVIPLALTLAAGLLYPILFPSGFHAFAARWNEAQAVESEHFEGGVLGRALSNMTDFTGLLGQAPLLGYGLGLGGNASTRLGATIEGQLPLSLAESDWARQIVDLGPIFGLAFIVFRVALLASIGKKVVAASREFPVPYPMLLFGFLAPELLVGQITGHGTVNAYAWMFCGLCLAACSIRADSSPASYWVRRTMRERSRRRAGPSA